MADRTEDQIKEELQQTNRVIEAACTMCNAARVSEARLVHVLAAAWALADGGPDAEPRMLRRRIEALADALCRLPPTHTTDAEEGKFHEKAPGNV